MNPFSVVIAWRHRPELARTLRANAHLFAQHCEEVTIVNCGGEPEELAALIRDVPIAGLRQVDVPGVPFNKCLANNVGLASSTRPCIFFVDADIILESDVFAEAQRWIEREPCFVKVRTVHESKPAPSPTMKTVKEIVTTTRLTFNNGRRAYTRTFSGGDGSRCGAGLLLMRREHLLAVRGFNSAIKGWGFDDVDLHFRLEFALGLKLRAVGRVLHLTHGDEVRDILSGSAAQDSQRNMILCAENYSRDQFMGSLDADYACWQSRLRAEDRPCA